jgi:hypothetical protein
MSLEKNKTVTKEEPKKKPSLKYQRDKDREKVKGIFKFYECPGSELRFSFRKYKEDPVETYKFVDDQIYTIPLGVAKHLNSSGQYPVHEYMQDADGKVSMMVGQKKRRYGFQSLEFVDVDELATAPSEVVTVKRI